MNSGCFFEDKAACIRHNWVDARVREQPHIAHAVEPTRRDNRFRFTIVKNKYINVKIQRRAKSLFTLFFRPTSKQFFRVIHLIFSRI